VTVVIQTFAIYDFAYPFFYLSVVRSISILFVVMVEAAAQAHCVGCPVSLTHVIILIPGTAN
jgi:hypothetical protein